MSPDREQEIRHAALEEAAQLMDRLGDEYAAEMIRALKDKQDGLIVVPNAGRPSDDGRCRVTGTCVNALNGGASSPKHSAPPTASANIASATPPDAGDAKAAKKKKSRVAHVSLVSRHERRGASRRRASRRATALQSACRDAQHGTSRYCCRHCRNSHACGDSCISWSRTCHRAPGCAC